MKFRLVTALMISLGLALPLMAGGCAVKTDLLKPDGKPTPKDQKDPSKPPNPTDTL